MKSKLEPAEKVGADGTYDDETLKLDEWSQQDWGYIRARHEAVNKRLRHFNVLQKRFDLLSIVIHLFHVFLT